ncbi:hypothetical protein NQ315_012040 [Exocentrus adspersus]|uniref:RNase H type-1 domain-containing protein n=1 Tax=Exocentrus adspersus TaxID=1586481 RepID=A0AAV8VJD1_9CUCU|nr:hypothetical protein NQ315_012040 [Exocentrus adspersus]
MDTGARSHQGPSRQAVRQSDGPRKPPPTSGGGLRTDGAAMHKRQDNSCKIPVTTDQQNNDGPWSDNSSFFICILDQFKIHAFELCGRELEKRGPNRRSIKIFSDSLAALKALGSYCCTSKAVWNCQQTLSRVGRTNRLTLIWIPGHVGLKGNEVADSLARRGAASEFIGPEPILGLSYSTARSVISTWAEGDTLQYWRGLPGLTHLKRFIPSPSKAKGF